MVRLFLFRGTVASLMMYSTADPKIIHPPQNHSIPPQEPMSIVAMARIKAAKPRIKTLPDNPSLYRTKTNPAKTKTVPASGCNRIRPAGMPTIRIEKILDLMLFHFEESRLK